MAEPEHFQIQPTIAWEDFPDEVVAIDLERGIYFNLSGGGADTFRAFAHPTSVEAVVTQLGALYDAPAEALEEAIRGLVTALRGEGLLVPAGGPAGPSAALGEQGQRAFVGFELHKHEDLQELLVIDPVHGVADEGWPVKKPD